MQRFGQSGGRLTGRYQARDLISVPVTDKIFATTVASTLLIRGGLSLGQVLLLNVRELGEIPLMLRMLFSPRAGVHRGTHASANVPGKLTTVVQ